VNHNPEVYVSKNTKNFIQASFGHSNGMVVGLSIMESSRNSIVVDVLHVYEPSIKPPPFGSLYISNSDGSEFRLSMEHTNRNLGSSLVDFERIGSKFFEGLVVLMARHNAG
jgi:hypothetical protein